MLYCAFQWILPWQDLKCNIKNSKLDPVPGCLKEPLRVLTELPVGRLLVSPQHFRTVWISWQARKTTTQFEETLLSRSDLRFQVGAEWNISDQTLYELEKNRLTVSSPTPTARINSIQSQHTRGSTALAATGCAMHPESRKRIVWDCLAMVALCTEVESRGKTFGWCHVASTLCGSYINPFKPRNPLVYHYG